MLWWKESWPTSSLDLNPLDYYIWSVLKRESKKHACPYSL